MKNTFNPKKRHTLKLLTGLTTSGVLAGTPMAAAMASALSSPSAAKDIINCTLISRKDISRAHLLLRNKTDTDIVLSNFNTQLIQYDGTTLDIAKAFMESVIIPANDRMMIRLNTDAEINSTFNHLINKGAVANMDGATEYLPQGTRVVDFTARVLHGVGTINRVPVLA